MATTFHAIYDAQYAYVWNTLRRLGIRRNELKDFVQDVFLVVYRRLSSYDEARPLRPWLFGIAYRVVSNRRRQERGQPPRSAVTAATEDLPSSSAGPEEAARAAENRALVARALEALDLEKRAVFVMHELDECPMPEIARELDIPLNTAYSRLRLARQAFAAAVRATAAEPTLPDVEVQTRPVRSQGERP
ncbi:MAG TPA: RNA polymerase sigma factor [Myxococcales bacterium]